MFKLLVLLTFYNTTLWANSKSINPNFVEYNLYDLKAYASHSNQGYRVSGIAFSESGETYTQGGISFYVDDSTYELTQKLSIGVFEATPGDSASAHGTAFHVGGNLILTNQHVLSVSRKNTTECRSFRIQLNNNQKNKSLSCKKVYYCDKDLDFCLIEMHEHKKGYSLSKQTAHKLKLDVNTSKNLRTIAIGNTQGFGLHASSGFGLEPVQGVYKFYAPVFGGNSGGPLFNEFGEVIALVRSQSKELYGTNSYNISVPLLTIYQILNEKLKDQPDVLSQINFIP